MEGENEIGRETGRVKKIGTGGMCMHNGTFQLTHIFIHACMQIYISAYTFVWIYKYVDIV